MIRDFVPADLPSVHALWTECFGSLKEEDAEGPLLSTHHRNPGLFLVAEQDSRIVGSALGTTDGRRGFLYRVAVAPSHRRRGIAGLLVREASRRLFDHGLGVIHLRVEGDNAGAIAFYETLRFSADPPVMGMRLTRERR